MTMKALILAAGRGERMGMLTESMPKPLLTVADYHLIEYPLLRLKQAGITEIVINVFYQGEQIKAALGDGSRYGVSILYSEEKERLEVGGGILHALPLLGNQPFIVVSSDVLTDYSFTQLPRHLNGLAHLVMVDNPPFHPQGDFGLSAGHVSLEARPKLNFGGIGVYTPELFASCRPGFLRWSEVMVKAIQQGLVTGEHYQGGWYNIGTAQDLQDAQLRAQEHANLSLSSAIIK